jgi:hypothetical protein
VGMHRGCVTVWATLKQLCSDGNVKTYARGLKWNRKLSYQGNLFLSPHPLVLLCLTLAENNTCKPGQCSLY